MAERLNLGCGEKRMEGFINIDRISLPQADLIWDLERTPLPFDDNSIDHIHASHVLEHIDNYMALLIDLYRIAKPGARLSVVAPYYKYEGTYRDPTHRSFFTEHSFDYFQDGVRFSHYSPVRLKVLEVEKRVRHHSDVRNAQKRVIAVIPSFLRPILDMFFWNIYTEISFELEVVK